MIFTPGQSSAIGISTFVGTLLTAFGMIGLAESNKGGFGYRLGKWMFGLGVIHVIPGVVYLWVVMIGGG